MQGNEEETAVYRRAPLPSLILTLELKIESITGTSSVLEGFALTCESDLAPLQADGFWIFSWCSNQERKEYGLKMSEGKFPLESDIWERGKGELKWMCKRGWMWGRGSVGCGPFDYSRKLFFFFCLFRRWKLKRFEEWQKLRTFFLLAFCLNANERNCGRSKGSTNRQFGLKCESLLPFWYYSLLQAMSW